MNDHPRHEAADRDPGDEHEDELDPDGSGDELDGQLGDQLRMLLGPSDGLDRRTARDVDSALRARSPLAAAFELFGVGWWTVETLFSDKPSSMGDPSSDVDPGLTNRRSGADGEVEGT